MNAKTSVALIAAVGFFGATGTSVASETDKPQIRVVKAQAPVRLTDVQMDKVVAGKYTLNTDPANSPNSCNSGKCNYDNPQGNEIGKPVTGFNN